MVRVAFASAFILGLSFASPAFAAEAAPISPDSPEANGGASPSTIGAGISNDGSSASVSSSVGGTGSAPSAGSLGANDPAETGTDKDAAGNAVKPLAAGKHPAVKTDAAAQ